MHRGGISFFFFFTTSSGRFASYVTNGLGERREGEGGSAE